MSSVKSVQVDPNISVQQAADAAQKLTQLKNQANTDKSVTSEQIAAYKASLDADDMGGAWVGSRTADSILDDMATMADAQKMGHPVAGSDKLWAQDMADLVAMTEAASKVAASNGGGAPAAIEKAANDSSNDAAIQAKYKNVANKVAAADKNYQAALQSGDPTAIGTGQREVYLAYGAQYGSYKNFSEHMAYNSQAAGIATSNPAINAAVAETLTRYKDQ